MDSSPSQPVRPERPAPARSTPLKRIGRYAVKAAGKALARYGLREASLIEHWPEIAGERWSGATLPQYLNRRSETLTLRVSGAVAVELMHQEAELIDRINSYCGRRLVRRLKLVQGPTARRPAPRMPARALSDAQETELARRAAPIADANLKSALLVLGRAVTLRP